MDLLIVAVTGASGALYSFELLKQLQELEIETHLIISRSFMVAAKHEAPFTVENLKSLATVTWRFEDIAAPIASGSFKTLGMIIAPCSMQTLAQIAHGVGDNLITRAADVTLKQRRRLVLLTRESPLHLGHLENMTQVTKMGGIIAPEAPAFYLGFTTLEQMVTQTIARLLDLFDFPVPSLKTWDPSQ